MAQLRYPAFRAYERVYFRPYGKTYRTMTKAQVCRALRMCDHAFDRCMLERESPERAAKLREIEKRRTALANTIGAC